MLLLTILIFLFQYVNAVPVPLLTVDVESSALTGTSTTATFTFDNVGDSVGFGPFIDIVVTDVVSDLGQPTWQGVAVEFSAPHTFTQNDECVPHPYLLEDTGGPQPPPALKLGYICGQAGETFISVRLPLSSYGPEASRIDVSVPITLSTVPADGFLYANGGFLYGETQVINSATDPPIVLGDGNSPVHSYAFGEISSAVVSTGFTNNYANGAGYGWANAYNNSINLDIADGYTASSTSVDMTLADSQGFGGLYIKDPGSGITYLICVPTTQTLEPNGCVSYTTVCNGCIESITTPPPCYQTGTVPCDGGQGWTGGGQVSISISEFGEALEMHVTTVPFGYDNSGVAYASRADAEPLNESSSLAVSGSYSGAACGCGGGFSSSQSSSIVRRSLILDKAVIRTLDGGPFVPGAVLEFALTIKMAQEYTFDDVQLTDVLGDGLRIDLSRDLLIEYDGQSTTVATDSPFLVVDNSDIGNNCCNDGTDGTQTFHVNVTGAWDTAFDNTHASPGNRTAFVGPGSIRLLYYATIEATYSDRENANENAVFAADCIANDATTDTQLVDNDSLAVLNSESRSTSFQFTVPNADFRSEIFAVNNVLCSTNAAACVEPVEMVAGDIITFRIQSTTPYSAQTGLIITDSYPIPLFDITGLQFERQSGTTVDATDNRNICSGNDIPDQNRMCFRDTHTSPAESIELSVDLSSMMWVADFGTNPDRNVDATTNVDMLVTTTVTGVPWRDGATVVTLGDKRENVDSACAERMVGIHQVKILAPKLCVQQSIVARDDSSMVTSFGSFNFQMTGNPPFTGPITQAGHGNNPIGVATSTSNAAGHVLRQAALVINEGAAISRQVQVRIGNVNSTFYSSPANVEVYDGSGARITSTYSGGIVEFTGLPGSEGASDATGNNMYIIVYDVTIQAAFQPDAVYNAQLPIELLQYKSIDSSGNYVTLHQSGEYPEECFKSSVTVEADGPTVSADIITTDDCTPESGSRRNVAVGEAFRMETTLDLPAGTFKDVSLVINYSGTNDMKLLNSTITEMSDSTAMNSALSAGYNYPGTPIEGTSVAATYAFGDVVSPSVNPSRVAVQSWWMVDNHTRMAENRNVNMRHTLAYTSNGVTQQEQDTVGIRVRRQYMKISGATNETAGQTAQEGDILEICFTLTRAYSTACAYDVVLTAPIPPEYTYVPIPGARVSYSDGSPVPNAMYTDPPLLQRVDEVELTVPVIDKADLPVVACYDVLYVTAVTGVSVLTDGEVCADTAPIKADAATRCETASVVTAPAARVQMSAATADPCTDDASNVARVGELITYTLTTTLPRGLTLDVKTQFSWNIDAVVVSSRVVSYGACLSFTSNTNTVGSPGIQSGNTVQWSYGPVTNMEIALAGSDCSQIVNEMVLRVAPSAHAAASITTIGAVSGTGFNDGTPITHNVVRPSIEPTLTIVPSSADAGDEVRICSAMLNTGPACAYSVQTIVDQPQGFGSDLTFNDASVQTSQTNCVNVTLDNTILSGCVDIPVSHTYNTDPIAANGYEYNVATTAEFCVSRPSIVASIVNTGDACTTNGIVNSAIPGIAVGETFTYREVITLTEGTFPVLRSNLQVPPSSFVSAQVTRIGAQLTGVSMSATPTVGGTDNRVVTFDFGNVVNANDNVDNEQDQIEVEIIARLTQNHADGEEIPALFWLETNQFNETSFPRPTFEVVGPNVGVDASVTPSDGGAYGDVAVNTVVLRHNGGSGCAYNVTFCETVTDRQYTPGTVQVNGVVPAPTVTETADGFCFTLDALPLSGGPVTITYNSTFLDVPAGVNKCADSSLSYLRSPVDTFAPRTATDQGCAMQQVLERIGNLFWIDLNGNGIQNNVGAATGETPIANALVTLKEANNAAVFATTMTDSEGLYDFNRFDSNLQPNVLYDIEIALPVGYHPTFAMRGASRTADSDSQLQGTLASGVLVIEDVSVNTRSEDFSFDFGIAEPIIIGDYVWRDDNENGVQDDGAANVLAGVTVTLHDDAGVQVAQTVTDANGLYSFSSLDIAAIQPDAALRLRIDLASQQPLETTVGGRDTFLVPTQTGAGSTSTDNDAVLINNGTVAEIALRLADAWARNDTANDFGFVDPPLLGFKLGDYVWLDANDDNVQDAGEPVLANVQLDIVDVQSGAVVATTSTNSSGGYQFNSAGSGYTLNALDAYIVRIADAQVSLAGLLPVQPNIGGDDQLDSNGVSTTGNGVDASINAPVDGQNNFTIDFGFRRLILNGVAWRDGNADGQRSVDETERFAGLPVYLRDANGTVLASTTTQSDGTYTFSSQQYPVIAPGEMFEIAVDLTSTNGAVQPTTPNVGDDNTDSDATVLPNQTVLIGAPATVPNVGAQSTDFGLVSVFAIGDLVFYDANGDGVQDTGETGINGVTVLFLDPSGTELASTTTDADGRYSFSSLVDGVAVPQNTAGYQLSIATNQSTITHLVASPNDIAAAEPDNDSDGVFSFDDKTSTIVLTTPAFGENDIQFDFGFRELSFGDKVFYDLNADGVQAGDSSEPGIANVVVQLVLQSDGSVLATTTTDANGNYLFTASDSLAIEPGTAFIVSIVPSDNVALNGTLLSLADAGADDTVDSDAADINDGASAQVQLTLGAWGTVDLDVADFGFQPFLEIGDYVWFDVNGNGIQDAGETPIAGVEVALSGGSGAFTVQTLTDATGFYKFDRRAFPVLQPSSSYTVFVVIDQVPLATLQPTLHAVGTARDVDSNGVWLRAQRLASTTATTPEFGSAIYTYDFGFRERFSIGDYIWLDENGNGLQDMSEQALSGVSVELHDDSTGALIGTTITDANGLYSFDSDETTLAMSPSTDYQIRVPLAQASLSLRFGQLLPTATNSGADDSIDSDATLDAASNVAVIGDARTGALGTNVTSFDIGFLEPLVIGDFVWLDANGNGVQDAGEAGVGNVAVQLVSSVDGSVLGATTTNGTGYYELNQRSIVSMAASTDYIVRVDRLSQPDSTLQHLHLTTANSGADDALDSDAVKNATRYDIAAASTGAPGSAVMTYDIGLVEALRVVGNLWHDQALSGRQDSPNATPLAGVNVTLLDSNSNVIATTLSAADGSYSFSSVDIDALVPSSSYSVSIAVAQTPLTGLHETEANGAAGDDALDSDGVRVDDDHVAFPLTTGAYGTAPIDADFGFVSESRLGNRVWFDTDENGIQNAGEPGIADVVVQLLDASTMAVVRTTSTDVDGLYYFSSKYSMTPEANYIIAVDALQTPLIYERFMAEKPLQPSPTEAGADRAIDSNGDTAPTEPPSETRDSFAAVTAPALATVDDTIDFGWYEVPFDEILIGDYVWIDSNGDGLQDDNALERGVANVTVNLYSSNSVTLIDSTTTDATGRYSFDGVNTAALEPITDFVLGIILNQPALKGLVPTLPDVPTAPNNNTDSDGVPDSQMTRVTVALKTPTEGPDYSFDFGFQEVRIGSTLWVDADLDGVQDAGEAVLEGVTVYIYSADGQTLIGSTQTDENGEWTMTSREFDLEPDTPYVLRYDLVNDPALADYQATSGIDESRETASFPFDSPPYGEIGSISGGSFVERFSIGDLVFIDLNGDGLQTGGEPGIANVTLRLLRSAVLVGTTSTDANGVYEFESLRHDLQPNTTYEIELDGEQSGLVERRQTLVGDGSSPVIDSNAERDFASPTLRYTIAAETPTYGVHDLNFDAGFVEPFGIGDYLFHDVDTNGVQSAADTPLANVTLLLFSDTNRTMMLASTITDENGFYYFNSWQAGLTVDTTYTISMNLDQVSLADLQPTDAFVGGNGTIDSSGVLLAPGAHTVVDNQVMTRRWGTQERQYDYGFVSTLSFGDRVWLDSDGDGVQDAGELGIADLTVLLLNEDDGSVHASTVTDANGLYTFNSLDHSLRPTEKYFVAIRNVQPGLELLQGSPNNNASQALDSNGVLNTERNSMEYLHTIAAWGSNDSSIDFGFRYGFIIGDVLFIDQEANGAQDIGEERLEGVELSLLDSADNVLGTTLSDVQGVYLFSSLEFTDMQPNTAYRVVIDLTQNNNATFGRLRPTEDTAAGVSAQLDSNGVENFVDNTVVIDVLTPFFNETDFTFDAGFVKEIEIGDKVFHDLNSDGVFDEGEPTFADVVVELRSSDTNQVLQTTRTDANGTYSFPHDLLANTTYVVSMLLPAGYQPTPGVNAQYNTTVMRVEQKHTTTDYGTTDSTVDFPFVLQFNIGDRVFFDDDNDAVQSAGDRSAPNVQVDLLDRNGVALAQTTTNATGYYSFNSLEHNIPRLTDHIVSISLPLNPSLNGFEPTPSNQNTDDLVDSDGVLSNNRNASQASIVAPDFGVDDWSIDFGFVQQFNVGDYLWLDENGNGIQDAAELGVEDVEIKLLDSSGALIASVRTDANGFYNFNSLEHNMLPRTNYTMSVLLDQIALDGMKGTRPDQGADDTKDSDAVEGFSVDGETMQIDFESPFYGELDSDLDFGMVNNLEVGDYIWLDENADGIQDANEPVLEGVRVELRDLQDNVLASVVTNVTGQWVFTASDHNIDRFTEYVASIALDQDVLFGLQPTQLQQGTNTSADNNAVAVGATVAEISITTPDFGSADYSFDAGFKRRIYIGDFVWHDVNGNGIQDDVGAGLAGVSLALYDANGTQIAATSSDANGYYEFDSLNSDIVPGANYTVVVFDQEAIGERQPTLPDQTNNNLDSDATYDDALLGAVVPVVAGTWGTNATQVADFGFVDQFNIGDTVWREANDVRDGVYASDSDLPLANVTVQLFSVPGDVQLLTTLTDAAGQWNFNSLRQKLRPLTNYRLEIAVVQASLSGLQPTLANEGSDDAVDSDAVLDAARLVARWPITTPNWGGANFTHDSGWLARFYIGNTVFGDSNGNGVQDVDEPGMSGVELQLYDTNGTLVAEQASSADGTYRFDSLVHALDPLREYVVVVRRDQPSLTGFTHTAPHASVDHTADSNGVWRALDDDATLGDVYANYNESDSIVVARVGPVAHGVNNNTIDFGFIQRVSFGDYVWRDIDRDGQQDPGEPAIANVTISLLIADPNSNDKIKLGETQTDERGEYSFDSYFYPEIVADGSYFAQIVWNQPALLVERGYWIDQPRRAAVSNAPGVNDTLDSDAVGIIVSNQNVSELKAITGDWGIHDPTFDFGFQDPPILGAELGNYLWIDRNGDGLQDADELPLAGVTIQLRRPDDDELVFETITDAQGQYVFDSLADEFQPDTLYNIVVPLNQPALFGFEATRRDQGGDDELDSDGVLDEARQRVAVAALCPDDGFDDNSFDFGFVRLEIGDYVWLDLNHDGLQDSSEPARANVVVQLLSGSNGTLLHETTTNQNGFYLFTSNQHNLTENTDYVVALQRDQPQLATYNATFTSSGTSTDIDSNGVDNGRGVVSARVTTATYGSVDLSIDFGFFRLLEIGNYVWQDSNGDGLQQSNEPSMSGIVVQLFTVDGQLLSETTTDSSGFYVFDAVNNGLQPATTYRVVVPTSTLPAQTTGAWSDEGADPNLDSNGVYSEEEQGYGTTVTTSIYGTVDTSVDFGFTGIVSIGDYVWLDEDGNGVQDPGEAPIGGVELVLRDSEQNEIARTTTGPDGKYLFDNRNAALRPSRLYRISVPVLPAGLELTQTQVGNNVNRDSDAAFVSGVARLDATTSFYGSSLLRYDIGLRRQSNIGDRVFDDENGDGIQQSGEEGLSLLTVQLLQDDHVIAVTTTDDNGYYSFNSLRDHFEPFENYTISLPSQPALNTRQASPSNVGNDKSIDSNGVRVANSDVIQYKFIAGPPGTNDTSFDFGLFERFSIGDYVFSDSNYNGVQDASDTGIPGVLLQLFDRELELVVAVTSTDTLGRYRFSSFDFPTQMEEKTTYDVRAPLAQSALQNYVLTLRDEGGDEDIDSDARIEGNFAQWRARTPDFGEDDLSFDAGFVAQNRIGDFIWLDINNDGIQNENEKGIGNVVVQLRDLNDQVVAETKTKADGRYAFGATDGVVPGMQYTIRVKYDGSVPLQGLAPTVTGQGDATNDSNGIADYARGFVETTVIGPQFGVDTTGVDFGFAPQVALGDFVWKDTNGNGLQEANETPLSNVEVVLSDLFGEKIASTVTNENGIYGFQSTKVPMRANTTYFLSIPLAQTPLTGLSVTRDNVGGSRATDSDGQVIGEAVVASADTPINGGVDLSFDFGFSPPLNLVATVFRDESANGRRDSQDAGIAGILVLLIDPQSDEEIARAFTDAAGRVSFSSSDVAGLVPGEYVLRIPLNGQPTQRLANTRVSPANAVDTDDANDSDAQLNAAAMSVDVAVLIRDYVTGAPKDLAFGFVPLCFSVSGEAFIDSNENGARDNTEAPLRGATVELIDSAGTVIETVLSDDSGRYEFGTAMVLLKANVQYRVRFDRRQSALSGLRVPERFVEMSSNSVVLTVPLRTVCQQTTVQVEALPLVPVSGLSLGDRVFEDVNHNGVQDDADRGVAGVVVTLYSSTGDVIATKTTDSAGQYEFTDQDGLEIFTTYTVLIDLDQPTLSEKFFPTFADETSAGDGSDSDGVAQQFQPKQGDPVRAMAVTVQTSGNGDENPTVDFGVYNCVDTDPVSGPPEAHIDFTGDAKADFTTSSGYWIYFQDNPRLSQELPDVGVPPQYPAGTISGWDLRGLYLAYSPSQDRLFVGFDCFGICGDADGNGDGSTIEQVGAVDIADLGGSESVSMMIDVTGENGFDYIVGVPSIGDCNSIECVGLYIYDGQNNVSPGYRYSGKRLNYDVSFHCSPSTSCQDIEFTLDNFSQLPGLLSTSRKFDPYVWLFDFEVFAGSFVDGGIGEDYMQQSTDVKARFLCPSKLMKDFDPLAPVPAPVKSKCCEAKSTSGCADARIAQCVCAKSPFCCTGVWDQGCVNAIEQYGCDTCSATTPTPTPAPTPATTGSTCCVSQNTGGCDDSAIAACVCEIDSFCCQSRWDASCVKKVTDNRCSDKCGALPPLPPTPAPTPSPTESMLTCADCSVAFGTPGSDRWCGCCAMDCGGFQSACVADEGFCASSFRCAGTKYCEDVVAPTRAPTPAPTLAPFDCNRCNADPAVDAGSALWCECCANDCSGVQASCWSDHQFCQSADRCSGTLFCSGITAPATTSVVATTPVGSTVAPTTAPGGSTTGAGSSTTTPATVGPLPDGCEADSHDGDNDGIPDCNDPRIDIDSTRDITVFIYQHDDATQLVGSVTIKSGGLQYVNGARITSIGASHVPDTDSTIELNATPSSSNRFSRDQAVLICLRRPDELRERPVPEMCLAYRQSSDDDFQCEDKQLLIDSNVGLCGYTRHFTEFAIIAGVQIDGEPLDKPSAIGETSSDDALLPLWLIIVIALVACCCCLILMALLVRLFYKKDEQEFQQDIEIKKQENYANLPKLSEAEEEEYFMRESQNRHLNRSRRKSRAADDVYLSRSRQSIPTGGGAGLMPRRRSSDQRRDLALLDVDADGVPRRRSSKSVGASGRLRRSRDIRRSSDLRRSSEERAAAGGRRRSSGARAGMAAARLSSNGAGLRLSSSAKRRRSPVGLQLAESSVNMDIYRSMRRNEPEEDYGLARNRGDSVIDMQLYSELTRAQP